MESRPLAAPTTAEAAGLGLDDAVVRSLQQAGAVLRLGEGLVLPAAAVAESLARLESLAPSFTVSDARRVWETSRRVALPLLHHLDRLGLTTRLPDDSRRLASRRPG